MTAKAWPFWQWLKRRLEDVTFPIRMRMGRKIMWDENRKIVQISRTELVKGPCREQELEAMQYVAAKTHVLLPRVHRTYRRNDGLYIAMDFVRGERLDHLWSRLTDAEGRCWVQRIWTQLQELRAHVPPSELDVAVASISGGSICDGILSQEAVGPFETIRQFRMFLRQSPNLREYSKIWDRPELDDCFRSVLAHADVSARNIIVRSSDGQPVIIDWEFAGWWPEYWEQIKWHFSDFPPLPRWVELLDEVSRCEGVQLDKKID